LAIALAVVLAMAVILVQTFWTGTGPQGGIIEEPPPIRVRESSSEKRSSPGGLVGSMWKGTDNTSAVVVFIFKTDRLAEQRVLAPDGRVYHLEVDWVTEADRITIAQRGAFASRFVGSVQGDAMVLRQDDWADEGGKMELKKRGEHGLRFERIHRP
jgi:hypothetical protein